MFTICVYIFLTSRLSLIFKVHFVFAPPWLHLNVRDVRSVELVHTAQFAHGYSTCNASNTRNYAYMKI